MQTRPNSLGDSYTSYQNETIIDLQADTENDTTPVSASTQLALLKALSQNVDDFLRAATKADDMLLEQPQISSNFLRVLGGLMVFIGAITNTAGIFNANSQTFNSGLMLIVWGIYLMEGTQHPTYINNLSQSNYDIYTDFIKKLIQLDQSLQTISDSLSSEVATNKAGISEAKRHLTSKPSTDTSNTACNTGLEVNHARQLITSTKAFARGIKFFSEQLQSTPSKSVDEHSYLNLYKRPNQ